MKGGEMALWFQAREVPIVDWAWIGSHLDDIAFRAREHVALTAIAVGVGMLISLVLAAAAIKWPALYRPLSSFSGFLYTVPSLALFAFFVPVFGFSTVTAEIALVSYTLLILIKNTFEGITGIDEGVLEAADGMGYRRVQRFFRVELPLALPVAIAGVRIASVTVIGLVTVTALLGKGGLGFFILDGFRRSIVFPTAIVVGTVSSALLAAVVDAALLLTERAVTPWRRRER